MPDPRFYDDLAEWWPLFSPPEHYGEEAADLLQRLGAIATGSGTLLERAIMLSMPRRHLPRAFVVRIAAGSR